LACISAEGVTLRRRISTTRPKDPAIVAEEQGIPMEAMLDALVKDYCRLISLQFK